ncbi:hypothetical protein CMI37_14945 [Candidatus Pacearchaeota archaeon]|nr:hypothetical protein [Candidatus Pacearchaeota archaeon]|tara:strand:- start:899 stop:1630 length:732 start_codon:yes stop_codon:yes gene_type:complete
MAESGPGQIRLFNDFFGGEALATTLDAVNVGDFYVGGEGHEDADAGVATANLLSGAVAITSGNTDADTTFIGTGIAFDVALMAPIVLEARVQLPDLDTKEIFFGLTSILTQDEQLEDIVINASGTTLTIPAELAGFYLSDELTDDEDWHGIHNGGSATASTTTTSVDLNDDAVAGEWQVLRLEVAPNGTVRWYIDGVLLQTVVGAVSTTTNFAVCLAAAANTTEFAIVHCDYLLVEANRDWTV